MKKIFAMTLILLATMIVSAQQDGSRIRLIILADMGNEPDEEQQMMHMLMCSNEFDLEGLIAVTGKYLHPGHTLPFKQVTHPELFMKLIEGYEKVLPNLLKHEPDFPDAGYLRTIVAPGQPGYGIEDTGEGKSSKGSQLILRALEKDDPRPLFVVVNAGSNTLAQALLDFEEKHGQKKLDRAVANLRVFENGAQDNSGAWICHRFPEIHWIRSNYQTYCYGGPMWEGAVDGSGDNADLGPHTWQPYEYSALGQHHWALEHIITNHGPFGLCYPIRAFGSGKLAFLEGGGTIPWLGLVNKGLTDINRPWWGGWSGRFSKEKVKNDWSRHETVRVDEAKCDPFFTYAEGEEKWTNPEDGTTFEGNFIPVWRWRRAFFNDFTCRMDWCILPYSEANHHPVAALNGDLSDRILFMEAIPGGRITLDASGTKDPDGDAVEIAWWCYKEAGNYEGMPMIEKPSDIQTVVGIPLDAAGKEIHIILEVKDLNKIASLWDYRRMVVTVKNKK